MKHLQRIGAWMDERPNEMLALAAGIFIGTFFTILAINVQAAILAFAN